MILSHALQNIEARIEDIVLRKVSESDQFQLLDKKVMNVIDTQGKDIAVDISNLEAMIQDLQAKIDHP